MFEPNGPRESVEVSIAVLKRQVRLLSRIAWTLLTILLSAAAGLVAYILRGGNN